MAGSANGQATGLSIRKQGFDSPTRHAVVAHPVERLASTQQARGSRPRYRSTVPGYGAGVRDRALDAGPAGSIPAPGAPPRWPNRQRRGAQTSVVAGSNPALGTHAFARQVGPRPGTAGEAGSSPAEGSRGHSSVAERRLAEAITRVRSSVAAPTPASTTTKGGTRCTHFGAVASRSRTHASCRCAGRRSGGPLGADVTGSIAGSDPARGGSNPPLPAHADEAQRGERPSCKRQEAGSSPAVGSGQRSTTGGASLS
jgi:hypothetical protein